MKLLRTILLSPLLVVFLTILTGCDAHEKVSRKALGGYNAVEELDDEIKAAAALAVQTLRIGGADTYSFVPDLPPQVHDGDVHIVRAFSQVVAGINYRLVLAIVPANQETAQACVGAFAVTIYDHFGEMSVTQWGQEIECSRAMAVLQNDDSNDLNNPLGQEFSE